MSSTSIARVKSIISGDSVVLLSTKAPPPGQPPLEKIFSLAYVSAPRLRKEGDEPYAFVSRDYLRKLLVGKEVQFGVIYTVPSTSREYGLIFTPTGESVLENAVAEGMIKVREEAGRRDDAEDTTVLIEKLKLLEAAARVEGKGLWSTTDDGKIQTIDGPLEDPQAFLAKWKGKKIEAIVERVISGDRVAVRLQLEPKLHQQLVLLISGIRCPRSKSGFDGSSNEQPAEEFGDEAKSYVEARLLQRTVHVKPLGLTPQNQLVGTVLHKRGNIAEHLLSEGLARCEDFHSTLLGPEMSKMRVAEQKAKNARLRMFKGFVVKKVDSNNSFDAVVARIIFADQLIVRNKAGQERKVSLSSIRGPKNTDPKQQPWQAEAREFLRKKIIGKHVRVNIDGKRPGTDGYEEREMATVTFGDKNIALGLVEAGLASVIRHRRDDDDRSPIYDELLAAEEKSQAAAIGMYSTKPPSSAKLVEASATIQSAKTYLSFLQRQKRIPAVVDYVASGSRFKIVIPRENARLTFVLSGIRAPKTARNPQETSEPFGQEALDFVSRRCMQRDVEIDVETIDRVGGFIGCLYVGRENLAKALVEEGFATVHAYSAEQSGHATELFAAEARAKAGKKGIWHDWDPSKDEEAPADTAAEDAAAAAAAAEAPVEKRKDYKDVVITHVDPETCHIKLQTLMPPGTKSALEVLMAEFYTFHINPANNAPLTQPPRNGEYVSAKFTADNNWYRARIRGVDREAKTAEVLYIDYGNSEWIPWTRIRSLAQQFSPTAKLKPQAQEAVLSFVQFPLTQKTYLDEAVTWLGHMMGDDKTFVANVDWVDPSDGKWYITLYDIKEGRTPENSLNALAVREGIALRARKARGFEKAWPEVVSAIKAKEEEAQNERLGMWEYGDLTDD